MSTWIVMAGVWMILAVCVVLFVRGASPRVHRPDDSVDENHATAGNPGAKI